MKIDLRTYELQMPRGDTETLTIKRKDKTKQIMPFVTGDIVYFTVKKSADTEDKLFQKIVTSFESDGSALIKIEPSDTKPLAFGDYVYDVQVTFKNGDVKTLIEMSKIKIKPEVTYE